ncbi:divergent protein kinase domain 2A-like [Branchiostoma floridae]|uniref:Divergent protein kinase domain 2A-like n=2 Tax=Branchiostoma floridae TaxID=7739 RepID=A0A9J7KH28_BRAFL|nr:divergent protein kinase domain 2A-like [Branchiostoma floridae]
MSTLCSTLRRLHRVLPVQRSTRLKVLLLAVLLFVIFVYIHSVRVHHRQSAETDDILISWAEPEKCPACFGDTCELLRRGHFVKVHKGKPLKKGIASIGTVDGKTAIAKVLSEEYMWQRYESFICGTTPRTDACNPSSFILETILVTDVALKPDWLREAWRISHKEKSALSLCLSARFLQEVTRLYVKSENTVVDRVGRAFLSTSLLLNEEAVLLRYFTTKSKTPWPFPKFYGACGRVIVVEHAGRTLDTFMDSSWEVRVDIALQLLQLVDTLREKDPDWVLFLLDVSFQNFAVDSRGWVRLIDLDDVMVIDRRTVVNQEQTGMCNEQCYMDFQKTLYSDEYHCEDIFKYTPMMYASICARLLSNLQKHPERRNWSKTSEEREEQRVEVAGSVESDKHFEGLLHDPPNKIKRPLEGALGRCVQETQPGGRLDAVFTLQQILKMA